MLAVSNKDDGAHVDHKLDEHYHALSRDGSLGWYFVGPDKASRPLSPGPERALIRQMAYEIDVTLSTGLSDLLG